MLLLIAWRNIWRNKVRSLVVISSIAVGLWAGLFLMAFSWGMYQQHIHEAIQYRLSHIQLHHPRYADEKQISDTIPNPSAALNTIKKQTGYKAVSARGLATAMILSPASAKGVTIIGIEPFAENEVTQLKSLVIEGNYFEGTLQKPLLIGEKLMQKLHVKLKGKVVVTLQDHHGEIVSGAFRINGVFKSKNSVFDESTVFIKSKDLNDLTATTNAIHEMAVLLQQDQQAENFSELLRKYYTNLKVETWRELSPELNMVISSFNEYMYLFIGIILLALTFGIVNTMLMAVLERYRELGMLMAIGLNKPRIFMMIILETVMLALIGGPSGIVLSHLSIRYFNMVGLDLSVFSEGLASYGFSTIVYPDLETKQYLPVFFLTMGAAIVSAIYPAIKALRLNPVEAIRKI